MLQSHHKVAFVDLAPLVLPEQLVSSSVRFSCLPIAIVEIVRIGQNPLTADFRIHDAALIDGPVLEDEQSILIVGLAPNKIALEVGAVGVDSPSPPVGETVLPLSSVEDFVVFDQIGGVVVALLFEIPDIDGGNCVGSGVLLARPMQSWTSWLSWGLACLTA